MVSILVEYTIESLEQIIDEEYVEDTADDDELFLQLEKEKQKAEKRLNMLLDNYLDGTVDKERYKQKSEEINTKIVDIAKRMEDIESRRNSKTNEQNNGSKAIALSEVRNTLEQFKEVFQGAMDNKILSELVGALVVRVVPTESGIIRWYMDIGTGSRPLNFNAEDYFCAKLFTVNFEDARAYRKCSGSFLRIKQWQDIEAQIYIRK